MKEMGSFLFGQDVVDITAILFNARYIANLKEEEDWDKGTNNTTIIILGIFFESPLRYPVPEYPHINNWRV